MAEPACARTHGAVVSSVLPLQLRQHARDERASGASMSRGTSRLARCRHQLVLRTVRCRPSDPVEPAGSAANSHSAYGWQEQESGYTASISTERRATARGIANPG